MYAKLQPVPETIKVQSDNGSLRLQFSTKYNPIFGGKRKHQGLGMKDAPENWQKAIAIAWRIEGDLSHPEWDKLFDPTFAKYGLKTKYATELKLATPVVEPEPEITVGAMWEAYLEWKKTNVEETTFKSVFQWLFSNVLAGGTKSNPTGANILKMALDSPDLLREFTQAKATTKRGDYFAKEVSLAFEYARSRGLLRNTDTQNPFVFDKFVTPALTTQQKYASKSVNGEEKQWHEIEDEKKLEDDKRAFTKEERDTIIKAFYSAPQKFSFYARLVEFYFLTGCRTAEAIPLTWKDIDFERNLIRFSKSLGTCTRKVKDTKTGEARLFYFSNNSRLRELLLSIKSQSSSILVFPGKKDELMAPNAVSKCWFGTEYTRRLKDGTEKEYRYPGVVRQLAEQGAISDYLPLYHTRHTYITLTAHANKHDNNALLYIASACGNSVDVILKHYLGAAESNQIVEV
ncbi:MAG: site-specific integrase [Microcoleus sp.]